MRYMVDHDLHCHSSLSLCCEDERMTPEAILRHAEEHHYSVQCITDHLWDSRVPGANDFYAKQDVEHVCGSLPLPVSDKVRFVFGCETEYAGHGRLGIAPESYDLFSFIIIPPNHFHMSDVRPREYDTEEKVAGLLVERLEEISQLELPFEKIGIAHLTCGLTFREGDPFKVFSLVDEERFRAVMRVFARKGAGIELNTSDVIRIPAGREEAGLRLFRLAREEGCRFYFGSDAHSVEAMDGILKAQFVADALELTEDEKYRIP